jgi:hypothetical protein
MLECDKVKNKEPQHLLWVGRRAKDYETIKSPVLIKEEISVDDSWVNDWYLVGHKTYKHTMPVVKLRIS